MIAIKGIEMPKNCLDCPIRNYRDDEGNRCDLTGLYNRDDCCPLVEIITCKDCKYYRNKGNKHSYCTKRLNVDSITDRYREPDYYCADAERR
jgi:hypothetical protein